MFIDSYLLVVVAVGVLVLTLLGVNRLVLCADIK